MTSAQPFFTVIVPTYNVEEYLEECLNSILAQTFRDFELLAVNDGSTDESLRILETYANQDSRIRIIQQQNKGLSAARNTGLTEATGKYCLFVDSDDIIHPQLLEICHYFLTQYDADLVAFGHRHIEPHTGLKPIKYTPGAISHHFSHNPLPLLYQRHRYRISLMVPLSCCRTELSRRTPFEQGLLYEDYPRTTTLLKEVRSCVSVRIPLYGYTVRPGSIMHSILSTTSIAHYRRGLLTIAENFTDDPQKLGTVIPIIYPEMLKQIANAIFRTAPRDEAWLDMLKAFRNLLEELSGLGLLSWHGHKWRRYLAYRKLMHTEAEHIASIVPALSRVFH